MNMYLGTGNTNKFLLLHGALPDMCIDHALYAYNTLRLDLVYLHNYVLVCTKKCTYIENMELDMLREIKWVKAN